MFEQTYAHMEMYGLYPLLQSVYRKYNSTDTARFSKYTMIYHKIPKISPGAYIFQRPLLRGLFLEGLLFGGAYLRREICVSKLIGLAL